MCCGNKTIKTEKCPKCGSPMLVMATYTRCRNCQFLKKTKE